MGRYRIGTSGWNYNHWRGPFYPKDMPASQWFHHYAGTFDTVEINNTFYIQPSNETYDEWRRQAPKGFLYAVKVHRFLTHLRKLKEPRDPLRRVIDGARRLRDRLGPILFQFPPHWKKNLERLEGLLKILPKKMTHVVEFRDPDWLADDTYELLRRYKVSLCIHDAIEDHPRVATGPALYLRFHGRSAKSDGNYARQELRPWAKWIRENAGRRAVFVYFNNDAKGHAVRNALCLRELLEG